jgi:putative SOS response-associated peptidase YedK
MRRLVSAVNALINFAPSWNIAPTQPAPVVRLHPTTGERHLDLLNWGLVPHWTSELKTARRPINARSETAATTPMFRDALARRRCLVIADAFYEWQVGSVPKIPHAIARSDGTPMIFAGLWEGWKNPDGTILRTFTILTTAANDQLRHLHERMPVILEPQDSSAWLGESSGDPAALLRPSTADLRIWRVSPAVNNVRNNGPELLAAAD